VYSLAVCHNDLTKESIAFVELFYGADNFPFGLHFVKDMFRALLRELKKGTYSFTLGRAK